MGKKNTQMRTKGNVKPASSDRSAVLLSSTSGKASQLTALFPTLQPPGVSSGATEGDMEATVDADFRLAIKKLAKKDATTRLKALQEFSALVGEKDEAALKGMLPFWPRNFSRLAADSDRRVREAAFQAQKAVCLNAKKSLAPYMKSLAATWFCGMNDPHAPAATAARQSFEAAFCPFKHASVVMFCAEDAFAQLEANLFQLSGQGVPDAQDLDEAERAIKLNRIVACSLLAVRFITRTIESPEDKAKLRPSLRRLLAEGKFWKYSKHSDSPVRSGFYHLLSSLLEAEVVEDEVDIEKATKATLACLAEQDPTVCPVIWETALMLLNKYKDCWKFVNMQKAFIPQLNTVLKNRAYGNASSTLPQLLPIYSLIPEGEKYRDFILANLKEGMLTGVTSVTSMSEVNAVVSAYMECTRYSIVHQCTSKEDIDELTGDHLIPLLREVLLSSSPGHVRVSQSKFFSEILSLLLYMEKKSKDENKFSSIEVLWTSIYSVTIDCLDQQNCFHALMKFYGDLNSEVDEVAAGEEKAKKGVRFMREGEVVKRSTTSPLKGSSFYGYNTKFLIRVLDRIHQEMSADLVQLFARVFTLCCDAKFLLEFEKVALSGKDFFSSLILPWVEANEDLPAVLVPLALRIAASKASVADGVKVIDALQRSSGTMLLLIMAEAFVCWDEKLGPVLQGYFLSRTFIESLLDLCTSEDPLRWDVMTSCLHLSALEENLLSSEVVTSMVDSIRASLSKSLNSGPELDTETLNNICEVSTTLFESYDKCWELESASDLLFDLYEASGRVGVKDGVKLRDTWGGVVGSEDERALALKKKIAGHLRRRICTAASGQRELLIQNCLELTHERSDDELVLSILPSEEDLDQLCASNQISNCVFSNICLPSQSGPWLLAGATYVDQTGPYVETLSSACGVMMDVCKALDCVHLLDMRYVLLANLLEPIPKLKSCISDTIESNTAATSLVANLVSKCNSDPMWLAVLDHTLSLIDSMRPSCTWQWTSCKTQLQQVFIKYERDKSKMSSLLGSKVNRMTTSAEIEEFAEDLCLVAKCVQFGVREEETDRALVKLLAALQGRKGDKPELYNSQSPSNFQLSVARLFLSIIRHSPSTLQTLSWDFLLLTMASFIDKFPWQSPGLSYVSVQLGVTLLELYKAMGELLNGEVDENCERNLPKNIRAEWVEFYSSVVFDKLVPIVGENTPKDLSKVPSILLLSLASIFSLVDSSLVIKHWRRKETTSPLQIFRTLSSFMLSNSTQVQLVAYAMALSIAEQASLEHDEVVASREEDTIESSSDLLKIDDFLIDIVDDTGVSMQMAVGDYDVDDPRTLLLGDKDSSAVTGYLLSCSLVLNFCSRAGREYRSRYVSYLEESGLLGKYLRNMFSVMPRQPLVSYFNAILTERKVSVANVICASYVEACTKAAGVVRSWYSQLPTRQASYVEKFTTRYVAPVLIDREMAKILRGEMKFDKLTVVGLPSTREVEVTYLIEEVHKGCGISIIMQPNHPLTPVRIKDKSSTHAVSQSQWKQWQIQLAAFINNLNGSISEGLWVWKQNIDQKLEGCSDECVICFSVIHMNTLKPPNYPCRTCKKRFHKACMFKWFQQGHATCPLCRTIMG